MGREKRMHKHRELGWRTILAMTPNERAHLPLRRPGPASSVQGEHGTCQTHMMYGKHIRHALHIK